MSFDIAHPSPMTYRPFGFQDALVGAIYPPAAEIYGNASLNDSTLLLNDEGCLDPVSSEIHNCTKACLNATAIWKDENAMFTLQNCLVYPVISRMLAAGNLSATAQQTAKEYNIANETLIDLTQIIAPVKNCIDQVCEDGTCLTVYEGEYGGVYAYGVSCAMFTPYDDLSYNGLYSLPPTCRFLQQNAGVNPWTFNAYFCIKPDLSKLSQDVAGPGVFLSYILQIAFVLLAYIFQRILDSWVRNYYFWLLPPVPLGPIFWSLWNSSQGIRKAWDRAETLQKTLQKSEQAAAFSVTLVDFQKAQIFFTIAVQAAALIAFSSSMDNSFDAQTYQQLFDNSDILSFVAVAACLSTVFILFLLHSKGLSSWFIVALSIATTALCTAAFFEAPKMAVSPQIINNDMPSMEKCAGITPVKYCYNGFGNGNPGETAWFPQVHGLTHQFSSLAYWLNDRTSNGFMTRKSAIIFCWIIVFVLLLQQLAVVPSEEKLQEHRRLGSNVPRPGSWLRQLKISDRTQRISNLDFARRWILSRPQWEAYEQQSAKFETTSKVLCINTKSAVLSTFVAGIKLGIEVIFILGLLQSLANLMTYHKPADWDGPHISSNWSFGQVIAVTVWAPVAIEWVYMSIWGIEDASRYRIPKPYEVYKNKEDEIVIDRVHRYEQPFIQSEAELTLVQNAEQPAQAERQQHQLDQHI